MELICKRRKHYSFAELERSLVPKKLSNIVTMLPKWQYLYKLKGEKEWRFSLVHFGKNTLGLNWELFDFKTGEILGQYNIRQEAVEEIKSILKKRL